MTVTPRQPAVEGRWLRPAGGDGPRESRWGHPDGLQIGLHPLPGPRGLLRVYTPYLGHARDRLINFVAVEPIPAGATERGYSELERSRLDDVSGLRFWSTDDPMDAAPQEELAPSRGTVTVIDGVEHLIVHIGVERFANGADVRLTASFRADRAHEVTLAGWARPGSVALDACILSATMGNWSRLRILRLAGRDVTAGELWPDYRGVHFAEHASFALEELERDGDAAVVRVEPDELLPAQATHAVGTMKHWRYVGDRGVQEWRAENPHPQLRARVNGRHTYWMSEAAIPGGVAFENVELVEPFRQGASFTFRVEPLDGAH